MPDPCSVVWTAGAREFHADQQAHLCDQHGPHAVHTCGCGCSLRYVTTGGPDGA